MSKLHDLCSFRIGVGHISRIDNRVISGCITRTPSYMKGIGVKIMKVEIMRAPLITPVDANKTIGIRHLELTAKRQVADEALL